jgi:hypothetical protein
MKHILAIALIFASFLAFTQDFIILKNGDEIKSKVLEINDNNIKYKKYSNQDGPTYTMEKSKIFMIKYASGDKDVFNTNATPAPPTPERPAENQSTFKQNDSFQYDPSIGTLGCEFKKPFGAKIYGTRASEVFINQGIVYYGFDYTYTKITNRGKLDKGHVFIEKYLHPMNRTLTTDLLKIYNLRRWMRKVNMHSGTDIYSNYKKMDYNNFVVAENYCLNFSDVQKIINSYVLNEKEGIGMVFNVASFNKYKEYVNLYVTFFDIATREILYAVEVTGKAGGSGWGNHYANGINHAVRDMFIDQIYKKRYTNSGQIHPKLLLN